MPSMHLGMGPTRILTLLKDSMKLLMAKPVCPLYTLATRCGACVLPDSREASWTYRLPGAGG
jgi:hypothetical protein